MSVNYAAGLSPYNNKGVCGLPELNDTDAEFQRKSALLAEYIKSSQHLVVYTGAGISTASGIPDFRGPKGVWTLEKQGKDPVFDVSFEQAQPSFTHLALVALEQAGYLKFLITQNVDGLHLRSGFPLDRLAELHGNMFVERCDTCASELVQASCVPTIGQKYTGNKCMAKKHNGRSCRGRMRDSVLDWEDDLPYKHMQLAQQHSLLSDLSICLGTSLRIVPAADLPLMARKNPNGKFCVVNLQKTKHHAKADLVLHSRVDDVMRVVLHILGLTVPVYSNPVLVNNSMHPIVLPEPVTNRSVKQQRKRKPVEDTVEVDTTESERKRNCEGERDRPQVESEVSELLNQILNIVDFDCVKRE